MDIDLEVYLIKEELRELREENEKLKRIILALETRVSQLKKEIDLEVHRTKKVLQEKGKAGI